MTSNNYIQDRILAGIRANQDDKWGNYCIPPPVFGFMQAVFVSFEPETKRLVVRFPVLEIYSISYNAIQGGIIAAAVGNTLGPLSMLVDQPSLTRRWELTYNRPIHINLEYFIVMARLLEREGRRRPFRHLCTRSGWSSAGAHQSHPLVH